MFALAGCVQLACSVLLATLCLLFFLPRFSNSNSVYYSLYPSRWTWTHHRQHKYTPLCKTCRDNSTGADGEDAHKTGLLVMDRPSGHPHRSHPYQSYPQPRPANPQSAAHPRPANPQSTQPRPATPHPAHPQPPLNHPQPTRPQPTRPQPTYPHPTNPQPTNPQPTRPQPTYPHPTNPQPTYPRPTNPQPTYPHLTNPYPTPHSTHPRPTPNPRPPSARPHPANTHPAHPLPQYQAGPPDEDSDDLTDAQQQQQPTIDRRARRLYLQKIALSTVEAINNGIVDVSKTVRRTRLYHPDSPELAEWQYPPRQSWYTPNRNPPNILVLGMSTLQGAAYFHSAAFEASMGTATGTNTVTDTTATASTAPKRIGVLNFASATQPGGGFLEGARAQEESLARSSTLYVSLTTPTARPFYALHAKDSGGGFYSHSMVYSPNVHIFRDDAGAWVPPHQVDMLTSPAVNAAHVRRAHRFRHIPPQQLEAHILEVMRERMARILALFEREGARNLVLGSFGTGVFKNDVRGVARVWRELVVASGARFGRSFENVAFMVPDDETRAVYEAVLNPRRGRRNSNL